ncbi:hypothetical protein [Clostridium sp.]|uniref:hypothetical protein n=1 Tax=Clostridium sp. TaxID=1506 RepID=UPI001A6377A2|nr:hypothetical protein [Clostridium sp.]MBK5234043.1 hypothetical protein [Clostridium sp.]
MLTKITKNKQVLIIPFSTYKNFYKAAGWALVEEPKPVEPETEILEDEDEWDEEETEFEKPEEEDLANMKLEDLKLLAVKLEIDVEKFKTVAKLRAEIKKVRGE